ncbi:MAG: HAMP domain-containing sensor histidine kinase, partial [Bacteroidota bacterium]
RQLSEAKNTIEQQNNILEEKVRERTKELNETNAALMKSNTDLDNFIYKTSHDIRGPLATLQGMCNVALIDIKDNKSRDYFEKIGHTAYRLNEILSKLLIINQINNSLISTDKIDLKELIKGIIKEHAALPGYSDIKVDNRINHLEHFESDEVLLKIILGNLISNAYKFHNSSNRVNSWIKLEGRRDNGHFQLEVIDNGIGVDDKASSKIFEIFSKASEVSDTAGLGLYLVKLAVEKLEGKIEHSKTEEGFTKFSVELPTT